MLGTWLVTVHSDNEEARSDLLVAQSVRDQSRDLCFSPCEQAMSRIV
jgi:hypothetical protein